MVSDSRGWVRGFTLIELMIVLFIISILSAVAIPYMRGHSDAAKWSEGKTVAGTIRIAARAYLGEKGDSYDFSGTTLSDLGFIITTGRADGDLDGQYFTDDCYSIQFTPQGDYLVTVDAAKSVSDNPPLSPRQITLDSAGVFTEIP
ncbi:MAG: type II secretion system protein [Sedimentisphaerales bacterium]|jgi:prepilin-type N-terminal cleavage/methylation domain-containing protein